MLARLPKLRPASNSLQLLTALSFLTTHAASLSMSGFSSSAPPSLAASRFRSWPITEAAALEPALREMGLRVPAARIDGTSRGGAADVASAPCLSDALVSVGPAGRGGTGSFVSASGLIITNHHVALDAVRRASSGAMDYLNDGFVARSLTEEIPDADYEVSLARRRAAARHNTSSSIDRSRRRAARVRRHDIYRRSIASSRRPRAKTRYVIDRLRRRAARVPPTTLPSLIESPIVAPPADRKSNQCARDDPSVTSTIDRPSSSLVVPRFASPRAVAPLHHPVLPRRSRPTPLLRRRRRPPRISPRRRRRVRVRVRVRVRRVRARILRSGSRARAST